MSDHLMLAVLDALEDPAYAAELARRLQPHFPKAKSADGWLDTKGAAEYLGLTPNAIHKLTAARSIPFEQDVAGGKCWFKRSKLDAWREGGSVVRFPAGGRRAA